LSTLKFLGSPGAVPVNGVLHVSSCDVHAVPPESCSEIAKTHEVTNWLHDVPTENREGPHSDDSKLCPKHRRDKGSKDLCSCSCFLFSALNGVVNIVKLTEHVVQLFKIFREDLLLPVSQGC
jgi:hypothetical protein